MKFAYFVSGVLTFFLTANTAQAQMLGLSFQRITSNATLNIENQLVTQVFDQNGAMENFNADINNNEALFTFTNDVDAGTSANIGEIYFDDGTIFSQTSILNSLDGYTKYTNGGKNGINPGNLPSGDNLNPAFQATADFGADTQGNPNNGVNASNDIVGIVIQLQSGLGFTDLKEALIDGTLRLGLHVRSIGGSGLSDSFVNNALEIAPIDPVPIPAAALLFGPALLLLSNVTRRKPR